MYQVFKYAAQSNIGLVRTNNQDSGFAGSYLVAVADGMGGHAGGDVASANIIKNIAEFNTFADETKDFKALLNQIQQSNMSLIDIVKEHPKLAGMGTTLTLAFLENSTVRIAHIGDSRCYLFRDNLLQKITHDHTFVQHLVDEGKITESEAQTHPQRSVLMRVLGDVDSSPVLDTDDYETKVGDIWLFCSDGLTAAVSEDTIAKVLQENSDLNEIINKLISLSLKGGAPDNVTVVLAQTNELPERTVDETEVFVGSVVSEETTKLLKSTILFTAEPELESSSLKNLIEYEDEYEDEDTQEAKAKIYSDKKIIKRLILVLFLVILLLVGLGAGVYAWTQKQYFVGEKDGYVAIFKGIPQNIGPISLSNVYKVENIKISYLSEPAQNSLKETVSADSLGEAEKIVKNLNQMSSLPTCPKSDSTANNITNSNPNCTVR